MFFEGAVFLHNGCRRPNNEDNFLLGGSYRKNVQENIVSCEKENLGSKFTVAVFDGAGGADCGERASYIAAKVIDEIPDDCESEEEFKRNIERLNRIIVNEMDVANMTMGSTLAVLHINDGKASIYNLGDTRVYLYRDGKLLQISYDHIPDDSQKSHVLTKYLGLRSLKHNDVYVMHNIQVKENDLFMICSDGVYNALQYDIICDNISKLFNKSPMEIARKLIAEALLVGATDNVTCMIIREKRKDYGY